MLPPSRGSEAIEDDATLLGAALELAVARARRDSSTPGAPPPPAALRPVLRFQRLPARALRTVQQVLDTDEAFRARVADGVSEEDLDRASWLFLTRPQDWSDELDLLRDAARQEAAVEDASRQEQSAERRLAQLTDTLERTRAELHQAQGASDTAQRALAEERAGRLSVDQRLLDAQAGAEGLERERARAVRSLKAAEALAGARLEELRAARARIAELEAAEATAADPSATPSATPAPPVASVAPAPQPAQPPTPVPRGVSPAPSPWDGADPAAVALAVEQAALAATQLGDALRAASAALGPITDPQAGTGPSDDPVGVSPDVSPDGGDLRRPGDAAGSGSAASGVRPPRRTPVRLQRGVHEGSAEALGQLLSTPGVVMVVDGYNVSMEAWPTLDRGAQRGSLVTMLSNLRARRSAVVHVVFDGDDDGRRPAVAVPLPVRVHFSHAEVEADDVILDMVARLPTDVPVVVVSSDRRVGEGARRLGANVVRSGELIDLARR
ncbi:MAG: NYN domain-containing protein [Microthrixaceae bacterium]